VQCRGQPKAFQENVLPGRFIDTTLKKVFTSAESPEEQKVSAEHLRTSDPGPEDHALVKENTTTQDENKFFASVTFIKAHTHLHFG